MAQLFVNDEHMTYDINTHRYVITGKYFLDTFGTDLNS